MRTGVLIVKGREFDRVLPGSDIAIWAVPGVESRFAGIVAASCAAWIRLGGICTVVPLGLVHWIAAPALKYCPLTVSVVAPLPEGALVGEAELMVRGEMVKGKDAEGTPPAFITAIWAVPAGVSNTAGIVAASCAAWIRLGVIWVCARQAA